MAFSLKIVYWLLIPFIFLNHDILRYIDCVSFLPIHILSLCTACALSSILTEALHQSNLPWLGINGSHIIPIDCIYDQALVSGGNSFNTPMASLNYIIVCRDVCTLKVELGTPLFYKKKKIFDQLATKHYHYLWEVLLVRPFKWWMTFIEFWCRASVNQH